VQLPNAPALVPLKGGTKQLSVSPALPASAAASLVQMLKDLGEDDAAAAIASFEQPGTAAAAPVEVPMQAPLAPSEALAEGPSEALTGEVPAGAIDVAEVWLQTPAEAAHAWRSGDAAAAGAWSVAENLDREQLDALAEKLDRMEVHLQQVVDGGSHTERAAALEGLKAALLDE